jgi:hypothetical protein
MATYTWQHFTLAAYATCCLLVLPCVTSTLSAAFSSHIVWTMCHCSAAYLLHIQDFNCTRCLSAIMSILQLRRKWNFVFLRSVKSDTQFVVRGYTFLRFRGIQEWSFSHWFWTLISHNNLVVHYFLLLTCFFSSNCTWRLTILQCWNFLRIWTVFWNLKYNESSPFILLAII